MEFVLSVAGEIIGRATCGASPYLCYKNGGGEAARAAARRTGREKAALWGGSRLPRLRRDPSLAGTPAGRPAPGPPGARATPRATLAASVRMLAPPLRH